MKQIQFISALILLGCLSLIGFNAKAQTGNLYIEGAVIVPAGGVATSTDLTMEQSVGLIAFTQHTQGNIVLEQGVLHHFFSAAPEQPGQTQDPESTPVENRELLCKVYPNPCVSTLNVETNADGTKTKYTILSATGAQYLQGQFSSATHTIRVQSLPSGLYIILLQREDGTRKVHRFMKE